MPQVNLDKLLLQLLTAQYDIFHDVARYHQRCEADPKLCDNQQEFEHYLQRVAQQSILESILINSGNKHLCASSPFNYRHNRQATNCDQFKANNK